MRIALKQLEAQIERKKGVLSLSGDKYVLPNSGVKRTPQKRDLLRALALNAARQGRRPTFKARY